jgi:hypothetical protein
LLPLEAIEKEEFGPGSRLDRDFCWLAQNFSRMDGNPCLHVLVNKVDRLIAEPAEIEGMFKQIEPRLRKLRLQIKTCLGSYDIRFTDFTPISMIDARIFDICFPQALQLIYEKQHGRTKST